MEGFTYIYIYSINGQHWSIKSVWNKSSWSHAISGCYNSVNVTQRASLSSEKVSLWEAYVNSSPLGDVTDSLTELHLSKRWNSSVRPFPDCFEPISKSEAKCILTLVKMSHQSRLSKRTRFEKEAARARPRIGTRNYQCYLFSRLSLVFSSLGQKLVVIIKFWFYQKP